MHVIEQGNRVLLFIYSSHSQDSLLFAIYYSDSIYVFII